MGSNTAVGRRTPAQGAASRMNGARAIGPVTAFGKQSSASNSIVHGFATSAALMRNESVDEYRATLAAWFESLQPANQAEARLIAKLADLEFRQQRIARAEEKLLARTIEAKLEQTEAYAALVKARGVLEGVRGLAVLAETAPANVSSERVAQVLPGMNSIGEMVASVDLPVAVTAPLGDALEAFVVDTIVEASPGTFEDVARAARDIEAALVVRIGELDVAVEQERERIADVTLFPSGEEAKVLDRHRSRLAREIELAAKALKTLRELSATVRCDGSGSSVEFVLEVRALGASRQS